MLSTFCRARSCSNYIVCSARRKALVELSKFILRNLSKKMLKASFVNGAERGEAEWYLKSQKCVFQLFGKKSEISSAERIFLTPWKVAKPDANVEMFSLRLSNSARQLCAFLERFNCIVVDVNLEIIGNGNFFHMRHKVEMSWETVLSPDGETGHKPELDKIARRVHAEKCRNLIRLVEFVGGFVY